MEQVKHKMIEHLKRVNPKGMQTTIMIAFTVISTAIMLILGTVMYAAFSVSSRQEVIQSSQNLMEQTGEKLEDYLLSMRQISDAVYYNVIKESDFASQDKNIQRGMNLLYEANRDKLRSIAVYNNYGSLMAAEPVAAQKENPDVTRQEWYQQAMDEVENMHFSVPHIQNLFEDAAFRYHWVVSLSRAVEITENGVPQLGILLVDMDYSSISRMMKQINTFTNGQYYYLCDSNGQIIYHNRQMQISEGISRENSAAAAEYKDGVYDETFEGVHRKVLVNTIGYTGWKLVGVIPYEAFTLGMVGMRYFILMLMLLMAMMLVIINRVISVRISSPILKLNDSVVEYEAGEKPEIYIGGSREIRHLGHSIQDSYEQIDMLMKKIVLEQTERRKSELDALQSQINPHFLYNTLESIVWMIEGERNDAAAFMVSQLAKLFRISLSKGRTVISVRDELQHARSYMNIQKIRYKDSFSVEYEIDPEIENYCTVKLILQPILENAINYGVSGKDDCGRIRVTGELREGCILLAVEDNGIGMSEEEVGLLLTDTPRVAKKGSGVGLINVNNRIRLLFGREYGLFIESEPDEGTRVSIRFPAVFCTEENRTILEKGRMPGRADLTEAEESGEGKDEKR